MIKHVSVLAKEVFENLPKQAKRIFDGTIGHGGHVQYILSNLHDQNPKTFENINIIGVDKDSAMLQKAKQNLNQYKNKIFFFNDSYSNIDKILAQANVLNVDFILLDLGVNLEHFKDYSRGFSIKQDGYLDMRFDNTQNFDAKQLINSYNIEQLTKIFVDYGDFNIKGAQIIAQKIIEHRQAKPILTTLQLADILKKLGLNTKKIAVIFQTIRIEVNNELKQLEIFLGKFKNYLSKGGKCAIITYHSIEDRIVKNSFKDICTKDSRFKLVNKHVIKPTYAEIASNKASRSAKLRIISFL